VLADFCWHDERAATITKPCDDRLCCSMSREWVTTSHCIVSVAGAGARHCGRGAVVYVHWYQTLHACSFPPLATWHPPPTDCVHILYTVSPMSQHSSTCNFTGLSEFQHSFTRQLQWSCRHTPLRNINVSADIFTTVFWASGGSLRLMIEHDNYFKQKIYHKVV